MRGLRDSYWFQTAVALVSCAVFLGIAFNARSDDPKTNSVPTKPQSARRHQLTGAELYSMHCNRCHPERYPTERTAAQWKTILMHMRVRANLPAEQARTILKYL